MLAYKFRSIRNFLYVADIISEGRLYCSELGGLNDMAECDIRHGNDAEREFEVGQFGSRVNEARRTFRVCSLSKTFNNRTLWGHYADGFTGLAVEVQLPRTDVIEVSYRDDAVMLTDFIEADDTEGAVLAALSRKHSDWRFEEEVRIVTKDRYYKLGEPIVRVIVAPKMHTNLVKAVSAVCHQHGIQMARAVVGDRGIYTASIRIKGTDAA